jgi:hypothetical protein
MRATYRTLLLGVLCTLALSAVTASAASAHEFKIAGSPITKNVEASGSGGTVKMTMVLGGTEVQIECKSSTTTNTLELSGKSTGEYVFGGCTVPGWPACSVPSILYKAHGNLAGVTGALTDEISPREPGGVLFGLTIKNAGEKVCTIKGAYSVEGEYSCTLPGIETEATEHEFTCKGEHLSTNKAKVTLSYSSKLSLKSGQKWSAS